MTTELKPPPMSDEQINNLAKATGGGPWTPYTAFVQGVAEGAAARDAQWLALVGELQRDAERLNWMEKRLRGASDSERYLPFRVYWGDGRGIRKAIDAARGEKGGV